MRPSPPAFLPLAIMPRRGWPLFYDAMSRLRRVVKLRSGNLRAAGVPPPRAGSEA